MTNQSFFTGGMTRSESSISCFGIDRVVMLLVGAKNLREITLFPMNQQAQDLLMNAPSPATPTQLRELALRVVPSKKD